MIIRLCLQPTFGSHFAIEVKTGKSSAGDLRGLGELVRRYPELRPLVVVEDDGARLVADRAGFAAVTWIDFLLHGPPSRRVSLDADAPSLTRVRRERDARDARLAGSRTRSHSPAIARAAAA
jgi:hypothetical protein